MTFDFDRATAEHRAILQAAYDAGFAAGEAAARESLSKQVAAVLGVSATSATKADVIVPSREKARSPNESQAGPGSVNVRSKIIETLPTFGTAGATVRELAERAGLNEYSTRGMLNRMRHEGDVGKVGNRDGKWHIVRRPLVTICDKPSGTLVMTIDSRLDRPYEEGPAPGTDAEPSTDWG